MIDVYEIARKSLRATQLGINHSPIKYDSEKGFIIPPSVYKKLSTKYLTFWLKDKTGVVVRIDNPHKWKEYVIVPVHDVTGKSLTIHAERAPINGHTVIIDDDDEGDQLIPA